MPKKHSIAERPTISIAETVAKIRERLGESQQQFAQRLHLQQTTISRYELGNIVPGAIVLMQLSDLALPAEKRILSEEIGRQMGTMESALRQGVQGVLKDLERQWEVLKSEGEKASRNVLLALTDPKNMARMEKAVLMLLQKEMAPWLNDPEKAAALLRKVAIEMPPEAAWELLYNTPTRKTPETQTNNPITEIQAMCTRYGTDQRAVEFFRDAASYLRVRLSGLK